MFKGRHIINHQGVADICNSWQNQTGRHIADLMPLNHIKQKNREKNDKYTLRKYGTLKSRFQNKMNQ